MYITETISFLLVFSFGILMGNVLSVISILLVEKKRVEQSLLQCKECNLINKNNHLGVLSLLCARCQGCSSRKLSKFPILQIFYSLSLILFVWRFGWGWEFFIGFIFVSIMLLSALTDLKGRIIPNCVVLSGLIVIIPLRLFISNPLPIWDYALASLLVGCLLYALAAISKGGIGGGDIKLFALIGLFIGLKATLLTLFVASLIGYLFGMIGRLRRGGIKNKTIPFGPYIAVAGVIAYLWGNQLFDWYWSLYA